MILENCELWYLKADPKRPNTQFSSEKPTWELQIRTRDREQKKEWENAGLMVKAIVPDEGEPYFRVNLKKKAFKFDGEPAKPVEVVDANLRAIDPNTVGHESVGNVRIYQRTYDAPGGVKKIASVLMGVQITKLIKYIPQAVEGFELQSGMEVIEPDEEEDHGEDFNVKKDEIPF
jgi:hypothetical protein